MQHLRAALLRWFDTLFSRSGTSPFVEMVARSAAAGKKARPGAPVGAFEPPSFPEFADRLILDFRANLAWYRDRSHTDHVCRLKGGDSALLLPATVEALEAHGQSLMVQLREAGYTGIVHFHLLNAEGRTLKLCRALDRWERRFGIECDISFESNACAVLSDSHRDAILETTGLLHLESYMKSYDSLVVAPPLNGSVQLPEWRGAGPIDGSVTADGALFLKVDRGSVGSRFAELLKAYILAAHAANLPSRPPVGLARHAVALCAERLHKGTIRAAAVSGPYLPTQRQGSLSAVERRYASPDNRSVNGANEG